MFNRNWSNDRAALMITLCLSSNVRAGKRLVRNDRRFIIGTSSFARTAWILSLSIRHCLSGYLASSLSSILVKTRT